jgi:hypothetical protein
MKKNLIVARYNEDISWVANFASMFNKIIIFNKGDDDLSINGENIVVERLPNVGREAHSYLTFLTDFYDTVQPDELYAFVQANPFDHDPNVLAHIDKLNENSQYPFQLSVGAINTEPSSHRSFYNGHHPLFDTFPKGIPMRKYIDHLFFVYNFPDDVHLVHFHALWATRGKDILHRNKEFYQRCLSLIKQNDNPFEGHVFERMWAYIFNPIFLDWISHYDIIREEFCGGKWANSVIK